MKKYIIVLIGFMFLFLDIRFATIAFPQFEPFRTEAPDTVDLIIRHVIGDSMQIDIMSDAIGFILVIVGAIMVIKAGKNSILEKAFEHFKKLIPWGLVGLVLYLTEKLAPFALNGNLRFRCGYFLYFLCLAAKAVSMGHAMFGVGEALESTENHVRNNLSIILIMICLGCFVVSRVAYFYELTISAWIYYVVSGAFAIAAFLRMFKDVIKNKAGVVNEQTD